MKKFFYFAMIALVGVAFASCKGNDPDKVTFAIEVSDITATSATIKVVPSAEKDSYYWWIVPTEAFKEEYGSDLKQLVQGELDYYQEEYDYYGAEALAAEGINSVYDLMVEEGMVLVGADEYTIESLNPETGYMVFAFTLDEKLVAGDVTTKEFSTTKIEKVEFKITMEENDTAFFFIPSSNATYLADIVATDTLKYYGLTPEADLDEILEYYSMYVMLGYTWDQLLYSFPVYVTKSSLIPGQEMHFLAKACAAGVFNSDLVDITFNTAAPSAPVREVSALKFGRHNNLNMRYAKRLEKKNFEVK